MFHRGVVISLEITVDGNVFMMYACLSHNQFHTYNIRLMLIQTDYFDLCAVHLLAVQDTLYH